VQPEERTASGKLFQTGVAAAEKALVPMVAMASNADLFTLILLGSF